MPAYAGMMNEYELTEHKNWRINLPLINLIIGLIVIGVLFWLVNNYIPMDGKIKKTLNVVVVIVVVLWLLQVFGVLESLDSVHVGR